MYISCQMLQCRQDKKHSASNATIYLLSIINYLYGHHFKYISTLLNMRHILVLEPRETKLVDLLKHGQNVNCGSNYASKDGEGLFNSEYTDARIS